MLKMNKKIICEQNSEVKAQKMTQKRRNFVVNVEKKELTEYYTGKDWDSNPGPLGPESQ